MSASTPHATVSRDDALHGFVVEDVTPLPEIRCTAVRARHEKSGARLLHLLADDEENLIALAFRTPPPDHTGLPHILEHTVLCGSEKYPVKDPFVELLKTSLATFLNAMTYPDKTVYPCASMNAKDFFNLAGVYCDAVFHPLITEAHFKQEGHHFEFSTAGDIGSPLMIKGVVYNEMKGAYSDLDGTIGREQSKSICPDNAYGLDSGGDPDHIPSLTYDAFVKFHQQYYHPSNALIFLYGNIPTEQHLAFLDSEYLSAFDAIDIDTRITEQPRWTQPVRKTIAYPLGAQEEEKGKSAVICTWLTNDVTDPVASLSMNLLDYYLLGNAASPLRKALIDAKLGEELSDSGYASYQRDTYFTVGLKGTDPDRADAIEKLVIDTCRRIADEGMDADKIEAAFHHLELSAREIGGHYPLRLMDRVYRSWLYEGDPLHLLNLGQHLKELRRLHETGERFFETQLRRLIVDNPHYSTLTFVPDKTMMANKARAFQERMATKRRELGDEDCQRIDREARELAVMQNEPNSPEALATLPRLAKSDVSPDPIELPVDRCEIEGRPLLHTDIFSGGISYLRLAFNLRGLAPELWECLPLFCEAMHKMGADGLDYAAMAEREAAVCGGIHASAAANGHIEETARVHPQLILSMKALDAKLPDALGVLRQRLGACDFTDLARLRDVILQTKVHMRARLVPGGSHFAGLYAARQLSRNASLQELFSGITQVRFVEQIAAGGESATASLAERLGRIRDFLQNRNRAAASFVGPAPAAATLRDWLGSLLASMDAAPMPGESSDWTPVYSTREGIAIPADVAFAARALPVSGINDPAAPALLLLSLQLSYGFLWNEIRVKGGAYGAHTRYNPIDAIWQFTSYRDPNIKSTLDAFARVCDHITGEMDLSPPAVEQAIIGTVKSLDQPVRPEMAVAKAMGHLLSGSTPEQRKAFRTRLLSLTGDDIRRVADEVLRPVFDTSPVCVVSSREKLESANPELGDRGLAIEDI